jgi:anaerobic selenocysteine-containing dehydrogenase
MMTPTTTVRTYCTLCGVGCPSVITIESGRVVRLDADREHPEGGAVCGKGPRRTGDPRPPASRELPRGAHLTKTSGDPGWKARLVG